MAMLSAAGARTFDMDTGNAVEVMLALCGGGVVAMIATCIFVTYAGNARSFPLCSLEFMTLAAAETYAGFRIGDDN